MSLYYLSVFATKFGAGTSIDKSRMAENLPKHRASRAGFRAHLTQILQKAGTLMAKETPTEADLVSLKTILEQLARKKENY